MIICEYNKNIYQDDSFIIRVINSYNVLFLFKRTVVLSYLLYYNFKKLVTYARKKICIYPKICNISVAQFKENVFVALIIKYVFTCTYLSDYTRHFYLKKKKSRLQE